MLFSTQKKFVKIDIPKTASRSYRESLWDTGYLEPFGGSDSGNNRKWQHATFSELCDHEDFDKAIDQNYYIHTIVRNPWDRYVSFVNFYLSKPDIQYFRFNQVFKNPTREEFHRNYKAETLFKKIKNNPVWRTQIEYITNDKGDIVVENIGKFEDIKNEFSNFCSAVKINEKIDFKHSNKSNPYITAEDIFNQECIDYIAEKEKPIIDMMGYTY